MILSRPPPPELQSLASLVWASHQESPSTDAPVREHVLPTGATHVAFRLCDEPLRIYDDAGDRVGRLIGHAVVGGARSAHYIRDVSTPSASVGVMLRPGAVERLFGASAEELANRHTPLDDLWGRPVDLVRERLLETPDPEQRLRILESFLASRMPVNREQNPAIPWAMQQFDASADVDSVVKGSGYSHRHFISLFRRAVGLTPKLYCRVRRFRDAIQSVAEQPAAGLADVALRTGYSDQAHFARDFKDFSGLTPTEYRAIAPLLPGHVGLPHRR